MPQEIITVEQCINNQSFQNWLIKVDLMRRRKTYDRKLPYGIPLEEGEPLRSRTHKRLLEIFCQNRGYLVSRDTLVRQFYGDQAGKSEFKAMHFSISRLRDKLERRNDVFEAVGIGWGMGVTRLALPSRKLTLCYALWDGMEFAATPEYLMEALYGEDTQANKFSLRTNIYQLRQIFKQKKAKVSIDSDINSGGYYLREQAA